MNKKPQVSNVCFLVIASLLLCTCAPRVRSGVRKGWETTFDYLNVKLYAAYRERHCLPYDQRGPAYALFSLFEGHENTAYLEDILGAAFLPFEMDAEEERVSNEKVVYANGENACNLFDVPPYIILLLKAPMNEAGEFLAISSQFVVYRVSPSATDTQIAMESCLEMQLEKLSEVAQLIMVAELPDIFQHPR